MLFSSNTYDIIIVGGGISGMFLAYKLSETDLKILLIEGSDTLGGRIKTQHLGGVIYEAGAARFHKTHTKLITLINELGLSDKIMNISNETNYYLRGFLNENQNYNNNPLNDKLDCKKLLKKSYQMRHKIPPEKLRNLNYFQYLNIIYGHEKSEFIKDSFGYDSEFLKLNAESAMIMFKDDFLFDDNNYQILSGGLSQLIDKMENKIRKFSNIRILKGCKVDEIYDTYLETKNGKFYYDKLICAIPQKSLKEYKILKDVDEINHVNPIPLLRIYIKYPKNNIWFKNIKRTITNHDIRHIIPIDYENGLIMISYSDGDSAESWGNIYNNGEDFLINVINNEIFRIFGIKPPKHEFLSYHMWDDGIHFWKPGISMEDSYLKMLKPMENRKIYICGEAYSKKQGWMEGCLTTCYDLITKLDLNGIEINTDIDYEKLDKHVDLIKYDINYVLEKKEWIIMENDGKKLIYDISGWIPNHPGGKIILKGIEANHHYQDNIKYPESPMMIFNGIHAHNNSQVFDNFFKKEHVLIKLVGVLK